MAKPKGQGQGSSTWTVKAGPAKQKRVSDLAAKLERSQMTVVTDYRGMTMGEISTLRNQLRKADAEFHVVKNTLALRAVKEKGQDPLASALTGTSALALCFGELADPAKILTDFARTSKFLKIRSAFLQGQLVDASRILEVANLPPRSVLQAQLLGAIQGPAANTVGVLSSPLQGLLAVLQARAKQLESA